MKNSERIAEAIGTACDTIVRAAERYSAVLKLFFMVLTMAGASLIFANSGILEFMLIGCLFVFLALLWGEVGILLYRKLKLRSAEEGILILIALFILLIWGIDAVTTSSLTVRDYAKQAVIIGTFVCYIVLREMCISTCKKRFKAMIDPVNIKQYPIGTTFYVAMLNSDTHIRSSLAVLVLGPNGEELFNGICALGALREREGVTGCVESKSGKYLVILPAEVYDTLLEEVGGDYTTRIPGHPILPE